MWPLNVGQVYTTLQRLERDGLVETDDGEGERSQKRFRITTSGDRELAEWLRTPPELVPPPRDELVIKVLVALQVPGTDVQEIVQVHRRHADRADAALHTHEGGRPGDDDTALALVADAELFRLEAIVRWLDSADVRFEAAPAARADRGGRSGCRITQRDGGDRDEQPPRTAPGLEGLRHRPGRGASAVRASISRLSAVSSWRHGTERLR